MALEQQMSCFKWQSYSSDYLDGMLAEPLKQEAEKHLAGCDECGEHLKHYRTILSTLANQPKAIVPPHIKAAPLPGIFQRREHPIFFLPRWDQIPWYLRTLLEGAGILILILSGIYFTPKLRTLYERNIEKNISDFKDNSSPSDATFTEVDPSIPPMQTPTSTNGDPQARANEDEISGEDESESAKDDPKQVGRSQLWRFTLKTVSPDEMRPMVIKTLTEVGISPKTPGLGGNQVPGGIEFDLVLSQNTVLDIKHGLAKLANRASEQSLSAGAPTDNFSWYRVKSKRKLPAGTSQVVIWLSQPNI